MARETLIDGEVFGQRWKEVREGAMHIHLREDCSRQREQLNPKALVRSLLGACQELQEEASVAEAPAAEGRIADGEVGEGRPEPWSHSLECGFSVGEMGALGGFCAEA